MVFKEKVDMEFDKEMDEAAKKIQVSYRKKQNNRKNKQKEMPHKKNPEINNEIVKKPIVEEKPGKQRFFFLNKDFFLKNLNKFLNIFFKKVEKTYKIKRNALKLKKLELFLNFY